MYWFKMDVDNNEVVLLRSNVHKVITAVTGNQNVSQENRQGEGPCECRRFRFHE